MWNQPSVRTEVLKQSDKLRFARSLCFLPTCFTETLTLLWKRHRSAHMFWFISDCHSIGLHCALCSSLKAIYRKRSWLNKADSCVHWEVIRLSKELGHALLSSKGNPLGGVYLTELWSITEAFPQSENRSWGYLIGWQFNTSLHCVLI